MEPNTYRSLDRAGALAGYAAVALLVVIVGVLPSLPDPTVHAGQLAASARAHHDSLLRGAYLGALMNAALFVFGAAVAARLRRAGEGDWSIVAVVGIAATSIGIVGNALVISFVRAVQHGARGDTLWLGYGGDHWLGVLIAVPLAVFLLGAAMGGRVTGLSRRWLSWIGLVAAAALALGAASVAGAELDGGILGMPLLLGYLLLVVWIVATSTALWRSATKPKVARSAAATT